MDGKIRVLVIDDNEELCKVLELFLKKRGFDVLKAHSAQEAMKILEQTREKIDVILLDYILPDMSGEEVLNFVRQFNPNVGIIMMTGVKDLNTAVNLMKNGADDYITKPFRLGLLEEKINEVLYKKAMSSAPASSLTAERATEILDGLHCEFKGRILRFVFRDLEEMNKFIDELKKRKDIRIRDVNIGDEMEVFVSINEEK